MSARWLKSLKKLNKKSVVKGKIFRTPVYEEDLKRIFRVSKRLFGRKTAHETMKQLEELESSALENPDFGREEPEILKFLSTVKKR